MTEPYLIAHKVRGEPAFDIAIQMEMDDGVWWIIPTSGHRAYPYWSTPLNVNGSVPSMPPNAIEHYQVSAAPRGQGSGTNGRDLLELIGLVQKREPMTRRDW